LNLNVFLKTDFFLTLQYTFSLMILTDMHIYVMFVSSLNHSSRDHLFFYQYTFSAKYMASLYKYLWNK
jgi:hypothetical protein